MHELLCIKALIATYQTLQHQDFCSLQVGHQRIFILLDV